MNKIKLLGKALLHPVLSFNYLWYLITRKFADILSALGYYKYPHKKIFLAGMSIGGSTWMKKLLGGIPGYFVREMPMPEDVLYNCNIVDSAFPPLNGYSIYKTHLEPTEENYNCIRNNNVEKILVMYRDLRDVAVSRYHRLCSDPKDPNKPDFVDYNALGREKGIDHSIEIIAEHYVPWITGWYEISKRKRELFHFIKFEDLKNDTQGEFRKVLDFYGIKLKDSLIDKIIENAKGKGNLKKNLKKSEILPFGVSSNFRSGKVGGWKNELTSTQKARCKELFGDVLIKLGYEKDNQW